MKTKLHVIPGGRRRAALRRTRQLTEFRQSLLEHLHLHRSFLRRCRQTALKYLHATYFGENGGTDAKLWAGILEEAGRTLDLLDGWTEPAGEHKHFYPGLIERLNRASVKDLEVLPDKPEAA